MQGFFYLIPMLDKINFVSFTFTAKRQYVNSVLIGSKHEISKKLKISDYKARKLINYGINHNLIEVTPNGFKIAPYSKILAILGLENIKQYSFCKFGNLSELVERNLYIIARANYKRQEFKIKQKTKYFKIKNKIETGQYIRKAEYRFYNNNLSVQSVNKSIVTGQKHISKLLGVSQGMAYKLLVKWAKLKFIERKVSFSKNFDRFEDNRLLRLEIGNFICDGSVIKLLV